MQRALALFLSSGLIAGAARAQAVTPADLAAVKTELAEDNKLLRTDFGSLEQRFEVLSRSVTTLTEQLRRAEAENRSLRESISKATVGLVTRKELEQVVDQLKEVDKKRIDDGKTVRETLERLGEQIEKIAKLAAAPPPSVAAEDRRKPTRSPDKPVDKPTDKPSKPAEEANAPDLPTEFYEHEVQERETLAVIIAAYNKEHGLKVRMADVMKANPKLKDPKKMFVGQKLRIPVIK